MIATMLSWMSTVAYYFFVYAVASWVVCYFRCAPVIVMRAWFVVNTILAFVAVNLTVRCTNLLKMLGILPFKKTSRLVAGSLAYIFWINTLMNPHIRIIKNPEADKFISKIGGGGKTLLCSNHTSFFDGTTMWSFCPYSLAASMRTVYKSSLGKLPLWGVVYEAIGSFPVFFTGETFSVDKEKQQQVQNDMVDFVEKDGGVIAVFPEGQLNKNPLVIQPIRFGMLKFAIEHKMRVVLIGQFGSHKAWPLASAVGGFPCEIFYEACEFPISDEDATRPIEEVAQRMRKVMQGQIDRLAAKSDGDDVGRKD